MPNQIWELLFYFISHSSKLQHSRIWYNKNPEWLENLIHGIHRRIQISTTWQDWWLISFIGSPNQKVLSLEWLHRRLAAHGVHGFDLTHVRHVYGWILISGLWSCWLFWEPICMERTAYTAIEPWMGSLGETWGYQLHNPSFSILLQLWILILNKWSWSNH